MATTNSNNLYAIFHPDHVIDILRAGGYFPGKNVFSIPEQGTTETSLRSFIENYFPAISEERYEVWLRFKRPAENEAQSYSLQDIESAHFFTAFRQEAAPKEALKVLGLYGIPIKNPLNEIAEELISVYATVVRENTANTIIKAWFGSEVTISEQFIQQLKLGYMHQQSPSPDSLTPIPSDQVWARVIAYNPGLRKFEEKARVLQLQDVQEILKRSDQNFRDKLKAISDKFTTKFSEIIDDAERDLNTGKTLSKWVVEKTGITNSYIHELNNFLSASAKQKSFLYTALLYLFWREEILNKDYAGRLGDHHYIRNFLINPIKNPSRQAIAEALFTIVYAGGPRVFQNALIEARMKILNIDQSKLISEWL